MLYNPFLDLFIWINIIFIITYFPLLRPEYMENHVNCIPTLSFRLKDIKCHLTIGSDGVRANYHCFCFMRWTYLLTSALSHHSTIFIFNCFILFVYFLYILFKSFNEGPVSGFQVLAIREYLM